MLLGNTDTIKISLFYKTQGNSYLILTEEELEDKHKELEKKKKDKKITQEGRDKITKKQESFSKDRFDTLNVEMKVLTWGDYNKFQDNATSTLPNGDRHFNYKIYKEERLKQLIVSWDLEDKGEVIAFTPILLSKLPYQVGEAIIRGFDESTYYDEEREKN